MTDKIAENLKKKLSAAVREKNARSLLFSGGLDSSILAAVKKNVTAITVSLESSGDDVRYARSASRFLKLDWHHRIVDCDEAIDAIPAVIKILRTFDPAIPNDLAVYFGLRYASELGMRDVMTGDGADEFFAGYDFMRDIADPEEYIGRISLSLFFSSNKIGNFFNMNIEQPFLEEDFIYLARRIPVELKIRKENGKTHGKWILRKTFEKMVSYNIAWQGKRPLETGSGMSRLREILSSRITDLEFEEKSKEYGIKFISKEHLYYYEVYRNTVGEIPVPLDDQKICPGCGAGMNKHSFHCRICGNVLDWELPEKKA